MKKKFGIPAFWILVTLLLPLFYVNVKDSHDWGDDFAQYLIQARNILEERPQTENGLVFDELTGPYALQAYPAGFPLILATAWWCFNDSMIVSALTISFFFFAFGIVSFFYFRKFFSEIISVLIVLIFIYNPLTLGFKKEILSDIPFSFFLLFGILLFSSKRNTVLYYLLTGIAWGFALSVRGIGAVLFLAAGFIFMQYVVLFFLKRINRGELIWFFKKSLFVITAAAGFYLLLNAVLFPVPSGNLLQFYADAVKGEDFLKWIAANLEYYYEVFLNFFASIGGNWQWLATVTKYVLLILILPGIIIAFRKPGFDDWLFLAYILVLFIYPYLGGGFRFLLPILPFLLKYIVIAAFSITKLFKTKSPAAIVAFLCLVLVQYIPGVMGQIKTTDDSEQGPNEWAALKTFEYISQLPPDAVIVFMKPRALSYYTNRSSGYVARNIHAGQLPGIFERMNAHYFLICHENEEVNDVLLKNFIEENKSKLRLIYRYSYFDLYTDLPG